MKLIDTQGNVTDINATTLGECRALVGGYIAVINVGDGALLVDEDGLPRRLTFNEKASQLAGLTLVGKVVHLESKSEYRQVLGGN